MTIRRILVLPLLVKFLHISLSELHKSSCNKWYPIKLRLNSGVGGSGAGEDGPGGAGQPTNEHWGVKTERCEQSRQEREALPAVGHFWDVQSFSLRAHTYSCSDGDGGDWINREGAEMTNKDGAFKSNTTGVSCGSCASCDLDAGQEGAGVRDWSGRRWEDVEAWNGLHTQSHKEKQWKTGRNTRRQSESDLRGCLLDRAQGRHDDTTVEYL